MISYYPLIHIQIMYNIVTIHICRSDMLMFVLTLQYIFTILIVICFHTFNCYFIILTPRDNEEISSTKAPTSRQTRGAG